MTISEKLTKIAEDMPKVFDAGKDAERSAFWDDFQDFGNRVLYNNAFQNSWTDAIFQPKYNIIPTNAGYMFAGTRIANLKKCIEDNGIEFDLSKATSVDRLFSDAQNLTRIPKISTVSAPHLQNFVYNCKNLISIEEVVLKEDGSQTFNDNSFKNCEVLFDIRFSGIIGNNINFEWSKKLSAESYESIIKHLSPYASATITVPFAAQSVYDAKYGSGAWLAATKNNPQVAGWTFKYKE